MTNLNTPYTSSLPFITFENSYPKINSNKNDDYQWDLFEKEYNLKTTYFKLITSFNTFLTNTRNFNRNQRILLKIHLERMKKLRIFLKKLSLFVKNKENHRKTSIFLIKSVYFQVIKSFKRENQSKKTRISLKSTKIKKNLKNQTLIKKRLFKALYLNAIKALKSKKLIKMYKSYSSNLLIKRLFKIIYMKNNWNIHQFILKKPFLCIVNNWKYEQKRRIISLIRRKFLFEKCFFYIKTRFFNKIINDLNRKKILQAYKHRHYQSNSREVFKTIKKYSYMKYKCRVLKDTVYMKISSLIVYYIRKYYKKVFFYNIIMVKKEINNKIKHYIYKSFLKKTIFHIKNKEKYELSTVNDRKTSVFLYKKHNLLYFLKKTHFSIKKTTQNKLSNQFHNYCLIKKSIKTLIAHFNKKKSIFRQNLLASFQYFSRKVRILFRIFKENQIKNKKFRVFKEEVLQKRKEKVLEVMIPYIIESCIEKCKYNDRIEKENYIKKNEKVYSICKRFINKLRVSQYSKGNRYKIDYDKKTNEKSQIFEKTENRPLEKETIFFNSHLESLYKNLNDLKNIRMKVRVKPKKLEELILTRNI